MKPVSLGLRVPAAIVDSLVVSVFWYYLIEIFGHPASGNSINYATAGGGKVLSGIPALLLMLGTAAYWIIPEAVFGATLGKLVFTLRVVNLEGRPISLLQSVQRNVLRLADFFPFYLTGFLTAIMTPNKQRLGDLWAKTIVVRTKSLREAVPN